MHSMNALGGWVAGLAGAAVITAISMAVTPEGRVKKVVSLVCGFALIIALIGPLTGFDYKGLAGSYSVAKLKAEDFGASLLDTDEKLSILIIEERISAYILDKGTKIGITDLTLEVHLIWSEEGYWYPGSVELFSDADEEKREKLNYYIETELGVREIVWRSLNES